MKKIILLIFCCMTPFIWGQNKKIPQKLQELNAQKQTFVSYDLFSVNATPEKSVQYQKAATDVTVLKLNTSQLTQLAKNSPSFIELKIPYQSEEIEVQLYKETVLTSDFQAKNEKGIQIDYTPGSYYRGIIKGDNQSLVAISIFENEVIGIISTAHLGNINLGKTLQGQDYVTYSDKNSLGNSGFHCGVDELDYNKKLMETYSFDPSSAKNASMTENCVRVYYEITRITHQMNGSNETNTLNWITAIHNNIATLYTTDDIQTSLSEVKIWTTQDPYTGGYEQNLYDFMANTQEFNGDLAHLVNYPATTSVAFLNSLCTDYSYAYSGIDMYFEDVPTYSWTIMAMTHEMGHGLGSPHTHACAWNGNNTAIDGCGAEAGYSEGCSAPIPDNGGTIMSYCHLISYINFIEGFGPQPAALIRQTVDSKLCLSTDCTEGCGETMNGYNLVINADGTVSIQISDAESTQWKYSVRPVGSQEHNWVTSSTQNFTISGIAEGFQEITIGNFCENGTFGSVYSKIVWIGDLCGENFTDTGGPSGNYGNSETLVATFYPQIAGEKVSLTFTSFNLESDYDYMWVYNGNSTNSAVFANGNNLSGSQIPGPFISTASDGAITVKFVSDSGLQMPGWVAQVDCGLMAVSDVSDLNLFSVYPNPTSDLLNISTNKGIIESVKLTDATGKLIHTQKINSTQGSIHMQHLPKGVYLLTIQMDGKEFTKKIIKK
jgi:hypothetical protein